MDINNVQRANFMIKELTKHGRVESFDSAIGQAQELYGEIPGAQPASTIQSEIPSNGAILMDAPKLDLDEAKLNSLLHDKLGSVLSAYNDGVMGEMDALRAEILNLKSQLATVTSQQVQQQVLESAPAQPSVPVQEKPPQAHVRQGNYTSSDVSVEKMFYCGSN